MIMPHTLKAVRRIVTVVYVCLIAHSPYKKVRGSTFRGLRVTRKEVEEEVIEGSVEAKKLRWEKVFPSQLLSVHYTT